MENLKFCKVRAVKTPCRAHATDACIDFFVPEDLKKDEFLAKCDVTKQYVHVNCDGDVVKEIVLAPGQSVLIPSGIHVKVPAGHALIYMNKSGVASKKHLHVGASVVDENYEGECHINVANVGDCNVMICAGDKIVQGVVLPINYCQVEELGSVADLYAGSESDRGAGGFGSTGTK